MVLWLVSNGSSLVKVYWDSVYNRQVRVDKDNV